MMQQRFRDMCPEDLPQVLANERRAYTHPWTEGVFKDCLAHGYTCRISNYADRLIGHAILSVAAGESHLLNVCIHPDCQGHGLGQTLVEHMLELARERSAGTMFLEVRRSNNVALKLYEKLGFNEVGVRRGYYPAFTGREDAIVLAKELSNTP